MEKDNINAPSWEGKSADSQGHKSYEKLQSYNDGSINYSEYSKEYQQDIQDKIRVVTEMNTPKMSNGEKIETFISTIQLITILAVIFLVLRLVSRFF